MTTKPPHAPQSEPHQDFRAVVPQGLPPQIPAGPPPEPPLRAVARKRAAPASLAPVAHPGLGVVATAAGDAPEISAEQVEATLRNVFPSAPAGSIDKLTAGVLAALQAPEAQLARQIPGAHGAFEYYMANARHIRTHGADTDFSDFTGHLPLVRVRLPATGNFTDKLPPVIATPMGFVIPNDRKIASLEMLPQLTNGRAAGRVDLITPPRSPSATEGARFGAIALYLGYTNAGDVAPSFFILEAGTATGAPMVLFYSPSMGPIINARSGYAPTHFSRETNFYSAWLTMKPDQPGEPQQLIITSTNTSTGVDTPPYIQIRISYENRGAVAPSNDPLSLILHAAARIGVIGEALHDDPGITEDIAKVLLSWDLTWNRKPVP